MQLTNFSRHFNQVGWEIPIDRGFDHLSLMHRCSSSSTKQTFVNPGTVPIIMSKEKDQHRLIDVIVMNGGEFVSFTKWKYLHYFRPCPGQRTPLMKENFPKLGKMRIFYICNPGRYV